MATNNIDPPTEPKTAEVDTAAPAEAAQRPQAADARHPSSTDELILEAQAAGLNQRRTAEVAGVHPKTVQRKLADPEFAVLVAQRRASRVRELTGQLTSVAADAITVIAEAMDQEQPIRVRLAAAQLALRSLSDYQAASEVDARIADLEQVVAHLQEAEHSEESA